MNASLQKITQPEITGSPTTDNVNHPSYYTDGKIETIDFIEDKKLNFNLGNVVKYVSRCGKKKSKGLSTEAKALEDLKKARFYLEREIANRERKM